MNPTQIFILIFAVLLTGVGAGLFVGDSLGRHSLMLEAESLGFTEKIKLPGGKEVYVWTTKENK